MTQRLLLTPLSTSDLDAMHAIYSDPNTWLHLPTGRHTDLAQTRSMIETAEAKWQKYRAGYWAVRLRSPIGELPEGTFIGTGGINPLEGATAGTWNLAYRLHPASWGHGLATEIATAALELATQTEPKHPVLGRVLENNPASYTVLEKIGLTLQWRGEFDPEIVQEHPWLAGNRLRIYSNHPLSPQLLQAVKDLG